MSSWEKHLIWWSTAAVALTGFVYAWMKYLMQPADEWSVVNHPLQPLVLKLHILVAPLLVFAIGLIASRHILAHLRTRVRTGRRSGTGAALIIVPMILSGYLIQAVTHSSLLAVLGYLHLVAGAVYAGTSLAHARATRRLRRAPSDQRGSADPQGGSRMRPEARSRRPHRIRS